MGSSPTGGTLNRIGRRIMFTSIDFEKIKNETSETPEVLVKWQSLLKDVSGPKKEIVAWILEHQERSR